MSKVPDIPKMSAKDMPLLQVQGLSRSFSLGRAWPWQPKKKLHAVQDVSFDLVAGETLGLVGESGCGKSTSGRLIAGLDRPDAGHIQFAGHTVGDFKGQAWRDLRQQIQMVWQNPLSALDPRWSIIDQVAEPLLIHHLATQREAQQQAQEMLEEVGLDAALGRRFPHELSGGQLQRVVIARALLLKPQLLICDEPVSALDVSVQAQVVNLLAELQERLGLTYLFISHDLKVVRHLAHRVAVMYLGRMVELAPKNQLFDAPQHPYTQALVAAVPVPDPRRRGLRMVLSGEPPSPMNPPPGCAFHPRCPRADARCSAEMPALREVSGGGLVACHHPGLHRGVSKL